MALFPRFGTELPANVANPATVGLIPSVRSANFRNCRSFRSPAGAEIQAHAECAEHVAQRVAALMDAYSERIAIVLEAGDIGEAEARQIAEAEIGRRFVAAFMPDEVPP